VRRPPTDSKIRTWRADDPQPEPGLPPSKAYAQLLDAEINVHVARLRLANDPTVLRHAAEKLAHRDTAERSMASIWPVPHHPLGPGYFVVAKDGMPGYGLLGKALRALFAAVTFVRPKADDTHLPSSLRAFVRQMRKGE
jgi:hypothetical protein